MPTVLKIDSFEAANQVIQSLQDQITYLMTQPQNLHGRTLQQGQKSSSQYVTQAQLTDAIKIQTVPGTTIPKNQPPNILNKANFWRQLQTFLAGISTKFVSIFSSGTTPSLGLNDLSGNPQWTLSVSQNDSSPSAPQGLWILGIDPGSYISRGIVYINHNQLLTAVQKGTFWNDFFCPATDNHWDLGKSSGSGAYMVRWGGIYGMVARFEGTTSGSSAPIAAGVQGLDLGMDFITASQGLAGGTLQPLTITAHPLTLVGDAIAANEIIITDTGITINASALNINIGGSPGINATIVTAALTTLGSQGSMTFTNGILTAQTPAT